MKYIQVNFTDTHILLSIVINSKKYGLKFKLTNNFEMTEHHIQQAKTSIARHIFIKHKIIVENFKPQFAHLFFKRKILLNVIQRKYTEQQIYNRLCKNGFQDYMYLVPTSYYRDKK